MLKLNLKIDEVYLHSIDKEDFVTWKLYEEGIGISDGKEYELKEDAIRAAEIFAQKLGIEIKNYETI